MTINDALEAFCTELRAGGVPHPLDQPVTLGLLWFDLALIAGEEPPPDVVERHLNVQGVGVEIHVLPAQAQCFPLPQAHRQRYRVEGFEPVALDRVKGRALAPE